MVEGACNRLVLETWLEKHPIPLLTPEKTLLMDNADFHKGGRIEELRQKAGCSLLHLPPYSPDINRIEKCWLWLKSRIRKQIQHFDCLQDGMEFVLSSES
jgi:transposase